MPFHFTPIWPVTPEHCLLDKSPISVPSDINVMPLTSSRCLMRVSGCTAGVRSVITGTRWQMGACPSEAAQQVPNGAGVPAKTRDCPIPPKSLPAALLLVSSAGPDHIAPSLSIRGFFFYSVSLSSTVLFVFRSDHLHCTQPAPSDASECIYYDSQKLDSI